MANPAYPGLQAVLDLPQVGHLAADEIGPSRLVTSLQGDHQALVGEGLAPCQNCVDGLWMWSKRLKSIGVFARAVSRCGAHHRTVTETDVPAARTEGHAERAAPCKASSTFGIISRLVVALRSS